MFGIRATSTLVRCCSIYTRRQISDPDTINRRLILLEHHIENPRGKVGMQEMKIKFLARKVASLNKEVKKLTKLVDYLIKES